MPNPYKARVDVRRFLNLAGFHGGAYVVAYVEDTSSRELSKRDPFGYEGSRYVYSWKFPRSCVRSKCPLNSKT